MKLKRILTRLATLLLVWAFSSTTAFAGLNLGNDDGTNFKGGTSNNYWGVYTDSGIPLNDTEGLRVTVYDAKTSSKVFNTIDITGNANIAALLTKGVDDRTYNTTIKSLAEIIMKEE